ncbi:ATPase inhibitor, mitochondrial-like [Pteropus medius]|uniref:ATPase inhibitor, mitochondrial-like n=1 Tax=Pteropus vampyrus TaxID=132908 RepID=UPI00196BB234|nr:ATPase inhibitor, mitochondrial-like [Pteropus giganteus]
MAVTAVAVRMPLAVWGVRATQAQSVSSDRSGDLDSDVGSVREARGAFGKREQAEEKRYF